MVTIGINGFGRIGRSIARAVSSQPGSQVSIAAVNDLGAPDDLAYALRRDSMRGRFPGDVSAHADRLIVNGRAIRTFNHADPGDVPWGEAGVDVVIEATGRFRSGDAARAHIARGGARKVVISASADRPDAVLVYGVSHDRYDPERHHVVSPASCGVNALTVMAKVLHERFGLRGVHTTVVLAQQGWQKGHDTLTSVSRNDPRLGRAASSSIIPHDHVAGELVTGALPGIGEITYSYYCVPTPVGSLAQLTGHLDGAVSAREVNHALTEAAAGPMRGVLAVDPDGPVSVDVKGNPASVLVDPSGTQVTEAGGVQVRGWFDGEWGFANRLLDLAVLLARPSTNGALPVAAGHGVLGGAVR